MEVQPGHPNVRHGLETFYKMMHEDKVMPILGAKATNMAPEQMFLQGELPSIKQAWRLRMSNDLATYPGTSRSPSSPTRISTYSIPGHHIEDAMSITHCQHPDAAWEFIQWWALEGMMGYVSAVVPAHADAPGAGTQLIVSGAEGTYNLESLNSTYEMEDMKLIPVPPTRC